ncbi:unnamed protein product [Discula destructiva]
MTNVALGKPAVMVGKTNRTVEELGWVEALTILATARTNKTLVQPLGHLYSRHDTFYAKSIVSKDDKPLTPSLSYTTWLAPYQGDTIGK